MTTETARADWALIHAERQRVGDMLAGLADEQWDAGTLCTAWRVRHVAAHITAAAHTTTLGWLTSMARARFNADRHNARLLERYLGDSPGETLAALRAAETLTVSPTRDLPAFLGEVVVHGLDIARPLHVDLVPGPEALHRVARFFAAKDFTVRSHTRIAGLCLRATDGSFVAGDGPLVTGPLADLVMVMAGRSAYLEGLSGPGVAELARRLGV